MKNLLYLLLIFALISCGEISPKGVVESKEVPLEDFEKVDFAGKFTVFYVHDTVNFAAIDTYPNVFDNLDFKVKNGTLSIKEKRGTKGVDMYNITLYSKKGLSNISLKDSTDMTISSQMAETEFTLSLSDQAKFSGSILANKVKISMDKKSRANILGKTIDAEIAIQDTASIIAPYWYVENLSVQSKNGNYTELSVAQNLNGRISNTAKLLYYGNPEKKIEVKDKAQIEQKTQP